jgi:hypothetical protein
MKRNQDNPCGKPSAHAPRDDPFNVAATVIFVLAVLHTFVAGFFNRWAHKIEEEHAERIQREQRTAADKPQDDAKDDVSFSATVLHFLGEVEAIFGIWALALVERWNLVPWLGGR